MDITYNPAKVERKWLTDGLSDVLCDVVPLMNDKRAAKPIARRLNVEKAGSRALAFCGTNLQVPPLQVFMNEKLNKLKAQLDQLS